MLLQIQAPGQAGLNYGAAALETALRGVGLKGVAVALDARQNTMDAAGSLLELWRAAGLNENERRGAFNYDPLGVLAKTGTLYYPAAPAPRRSPPSSPSIARTMSYVTALLADGRPYHEAGASDAQELGAMLATLAAYLRACEAAGLRPRAALGKIALALAADADLFLTMAKLRAARRLLARVADACGAGSAAASVHLSASTSERMMARRDPWVNLLRTTVACAGAAFGGAEAITVLPFTWALGKPDAFARRIARNTQLVLQEESSAARVIDPAHGSWYLEKLTDDLAKTAWAQFQAIEAQGGMARALETGFIQAEIARAAAARAGNIAHGRVELTGVSAFPRLGDDGVKAEPYPPFDPVGSGGTSVRRSRHAGWPRRSRHCATPPTRTLATDRQAAPRLPGLPGRSRGAFGARHVDAQLLGRRRYRGHRQRAPQQLRRRRRCLRRQRRHVACICSSDQVYAELAEATAGALKQASARQVLLAGRPKDQEAALKAAGVDALRARRRRRRGGLDGAA